MVIRGLDSDSLTVIPITATATAIPIMATVIMIHGIPGAMVDITVVTMADITVHTGMVTAMGTGTDITTDTTMEEVITDLLPISTAG